MTINDSRYLHQGITDRDQELNTTNTVSTIPTHQVMALHHVPPPNHHQQPFETNVSPPPMQSQPSHNSSVLFTQHNQRPQQTPQQQYFNKRQEPELLTGVNIVSAPTRSIAPFINSPSVAFEPKPASCFYSAPLFSMPSQTFIGSEPSNSSCGILPAFTVPFEQPSATTNPNSNLSSASASSAFPLSTAQATNGFSVDTFKPTITPKSTPGMQIRVLGVPQTGAKSRVETQIKLCIQLVTDDGKKAQQWSHLKLSEKMVTKAKIQQQQRQRQQQRPKDLSIDIKKVLFLHARVVCASDPSRTVTTCLGCVQRERKRSQRRKSSKKFKPNPIADDDKRLLLFNCAELTDFSSGDTILPTRITCYCRHQNEHLGFCIYFEMRDWNGKHVATGMSPPIMITDDHKANKTNRKRSRKNMPYVPSADNNNSALSPSSTLSSSLPSTPSSPSPFLFSTPTSYACLPLKRTKIMNDMLPPPRVRRVIPNTGSITGGEEVTVLGSGFQPHQTCLFGGLPAASTHFWSPNILVCVLPPACPGTVAVEIQNDDGGGDAGSHTLFTYKDNQASLMELALQVVGMNMTGKIGKAQDVAKWVVDGSTSSKTANYL